MSKELLPEEEDKRMETIYNPEWLRNKMREYLDKYRNIGLAGELFAKDILKELGFTSIRKAEGYDLDAEKNGINILKNLGFMRVL